jgi:DNA helicase II / ATP-dependent DNA helicase PcrA
MSVVITSADLIPIDQHFRVSAGPGAGKTTWLVSHIKQVLQKSSKLGRTKKVCCITYTNVAVDTILRRLDFSADKVEVSTIHGFIYKHIIKPYGSFIAADYNLCMEKVDGHDDHFLSQKRVTDWIVNHPNAANFKNPYTTNQMTRLEHNKEGISNWLRSLSYTFNRGALELVADDRQAYYSESGNRRNLGKTTCLDKLRPGLIEYKKMFWRGGTLHHDDVLFFGYNLLIRFPFIVEVLRAKFPYFYIDEFQDTNPIQTAILKLIAEEKATIGIIGDKAQSIYGFQGATPQDFSSFSLPDLSDYVINDNWRSTNQIVTLLNHVRTDINQIPKRQVADIKPTILIGESLAAYNYLENFLGTPDIATLSWDNITANSMKRHLDADVPTQNLIEELALRDSNSDRRNAVIYSINAMELAKEKRFKEAIKEMGRNFRSVPETNRRKMAFAALCHLLSKYDEFKNEPLTAFYDIVKANINTSISKLTSGVAATFYSAYKYSQVATGVNIPDDASLNRTIHRAKGDEFDNVMLILKSESDLTFAISPDLNKEIHRLYYVAISRAKQHLFINVPTLNSNRQSRLATNFNFQFLT